LCDENPDIQSESMLWRAIGKKCLLAHARTFNTDMRIDARYSSLSNDTSVAPSTVIDKVFPFTETGNHAGEAVFENVIEQWSDTT
jgi:hypothetical protein